MPCCCCLPHSSWTRTTSLGKDHIPKFLVCILPAKDCFATVIKSAATRGTEVCVVTRTQWEDAHETCTVTVDYLCWLPVVSITKEHWSHDQSPVYHLVATFVFPAAEWGWFFSLPASFLLFQSSTSCSIPPFAVSLMLWSHCQDGTAAEPLGVASSVYPFAHSCLMICSSLNLFVFFPSVIFFHIIIICNPHHEKQALAWKPSKYRSLFVT